MPSFKHLLNSHDMISESNYRFHGCVRHMQTIWVNTHITRTYQCIFPLSVSCIPVIRGQYTDCNLDMSENVLNGGSRGETEENNEILIAQEGKSCQMPPLTNSLPAVFTYNQFHRAEAEGYLPSYWPRNGDRGGAKWGWGLFPVKLQTVYINSMWESIIKTSLKNNALYSILYSAAKNVSVCWNMYGWVCPSVTVIVCGSLWCDHLLQILVSYQTDTPSTNLFALLS